MIRLQAIAPCGEEWSTSLAAPLATLSELKMWVGVSRPLFPQTVTVCTLPRALNSRFELFTGAQLSRDCMRNTNEPLCNTAHGYSRYFLAEAGHIPLVYLLNGGGTPQGLSASLGRFDIALFNPRVGGPSQPAGELARGTRGTLTAPDWRDGLAVQIRLSVDFGRQGHTTVQSLEARPLEFVPTIQATSMATECRTATSNFPCAYASRDSRPATNI